MRELSRFHFCPKAKVVTLPAPMAVTANSHVLGFDYCTD